MYGYSVGQISDDLLEEYGEKWPYKNEIHMLKTIIDRETLGKPVEASFTKKAAGGFAIGPKDGSWFVSLTDETFQALIAEYLRPVTRKLLFG